MDNSQPQPKWDCRFDLAQAKVLSRFTYIEGSDSSTLIPSPAGGVFGIQGILIRKRLIENHGELIEGIEMWATNARSFACYRDFGSPARNLPDKGIVVVWPRAFNRPNKGVVHANPSGLEARYGATKPTLVADKTYVYENNVNANEGMLSKPFPRVDSLFTSLDFSNYRLGLQNYVNPELLRLFLPIRRRGYRKNDGSSSIDFWTYKGTEYKGGKDHNLHFILVTKPDEPNFIGGMMPTTGTGTEPNLPDWFTNKHWDPR